MEPENQVTEGAPEISKSPNFGFNKFQMAAFACWIAGVAAIVGPVVYMFLSQLGGTVLACLVAIGIVLLATGGTLHQIGSHRERK